jgi:hypothetical protein
MRAEIRGVPAFRPQCDRVCPETSMRAVPRGTVSPGLTLPIRGFMSRFTEQTHVAFRWLTCGRRLFLRNPWLLGGMGFCVALLAAALAAIPFVGGVLIAFLAPILLASAYFAIEHVSKQNMERTVILPRKAIKQAPRELFGVFRDEKRVVPIIVACLFSMVAALLASILLRVVAGSAWVKDWSSLSPLQAAEVSAALLLAISVYFVAAWPLVYALPLTFMQRRPLFPAMRRSFKTSMRHAYGLLVILGFLLLPLILGAMAALVSPWFGYAAALITATAVLPIAAASFYCSYRTIFPQDSAKPAGTRAVQHHMPHRPRA